MKIVYFSTALTDEIFDCIQKNCTRFKPTFSGVGFDRNIADGMSKLADIKAISLYPIPSYPKYNRIVQKEKKFKYKNTDCFAPSILNLPILKELSYGRAAYKAAAREINNNDSAILISGLYRSFLRPARKLKKRYGVPIYTIVPDVPEIMATYRKDYSGLRKLLNRIDLYFAAKYRNAIDGYVFLSQYMNGEVNKNNKPAVIVDGLIDIDSVPEYKKKGNKKIIMYAGKISRKFGVDLLIGAFNKLKAPDAYLYLCGDGDYAEEAKKAAEANSKIKYLGMISHSEVMELEQRAALLVDPRPTDDVLVKMSFPSKIIEYMASGTPVLVTNLPCFSEEYRKYQYRIEKEGEDGIYEALNKTLSLTDEELINKGLSARQFIIENKTVDKQCAHIMDLIERSNKLCK